MVWLTDGLAGSVRAWLEANKARQIDFLSALIREPSDNPPGDCARHAAVAAREFEALGLEVERHPVPDALVRSRGMLSVTNLIIRRRYGAGGPTIALNAHGDVVAPGEGWSVDPYGAEVREGWIYGRGAAVSKSDFATYAFAVLALEACKRPSCGTVELHFTYDEETGGELGPAWILSEGLSRPDLAIAAGFSHAVVTAHNGCLHLEIVVHGRSAHAAEPDTGIDALECATSILSTLYQHRQRLKERKSGQAGGFHPTLVVGLISGGVNTNVVPDRVTLRLDRRITPDENPELVEAELSDLILSRAGNHPGVRIEIGRILLARPLVAVTGTDRLASILMRRASEALGKPVDAAAIPLYTDARHYASRGIPTVLYGAGPSSILEANAHRADERLPLHELTRATEAVACALADLLADGQDPPSIKTT